MLFYALMGSILAVVFGMPYFVTLWLTNIGLFHVVGIVPSVLMFVALSVQVLAAAVSLVAAYLASLKYNPVKFGKFSLRRAYWVKAVISVVPSGVQLILLYFFEVVEIRTELEFAHGAYVFFLTLPVILGVYFVGRSFRKQPQVEVESLSIGHAERDHGPE